MSKRKLQLTSTETPQIDPVLRDALADIYTFLLARRAARQRNGVPSNVPVK